MSPAEIDSIDPNACIHKAYQFSLYAIKGEPVIIRRWTTRKRVNQVQQTQNHVEAIGFAMEDWPTNASSMDARRDLRAAWDELNEWNAAMRAGSSP